MNSVPNTHDAHLFHWLFQSRGDPAKDPLVLWCDKVPSPTLPMPLTPSPAAQADRRTRLLVRARAVRGGAGR